MHGYRYPEHEQQATIARILVLPKFQYHEVSPLMKLVSRGDTTAVDAYLSPILRRYVDQVSSQMSNERAPIPYLQFMQSNGGLADAQLFQDSILSDQLGVVKAVQTSLMAGFDKIISFDRDFYRCGSLQRGI